MLQQNRSVNEEKEREAVASKEKFGGFKRYSITLELAYMCTLKRKTFFL